MKTLEKIIDDAHIDVDEKYTHIAMSFYPFKFNTSKDQVTYFEGINCYAIIGSGKIKLKKPMSIGLTSINSSGLAFTRINLENNEFLEFENLCYAVILSPFISGTIEPWENIQICITLLCLMEQSRIFEPCFIRYISSLDKPYSCSEISPEKAIPTLPVLYKDINSLLKEIQAFQTKKIMDDMSVRSAFSWFHRSLNVNDDNFKFLSAWIACETITKSKETNVKKIVRSLHEHLINDSSFYQYNNEKEAKEYLLLGRLHGIRGAITHTGNENIINNLFITYVQLLFAEMVFAYYKLPPTKLIYYFLKDNRSNLCSLLQQHKAIKC